MQHHLIAEALPSAQQFLIHACLSGETGRHPCCSTVPWCTEAPGPHLMQRAGKFKASCNAEAPGVGVKQGISFICKYHLLGDALSCQCKWYLGRSPLLQEHHSERKHRHACRFKLNLQYLLIAETLWDTDWLSICACLVRGKDTSAIQQWIYSKVISSICKYHFIAEALGCQRRWYLGGSPSQCGSTTVNGSTITHAGSHAIFCGHLGSLFAVNPCLSVNRAMGVSAIQHSHGLQMHLVQT